MSRELLVSIFFLVAACGGERVDLLVEKPETSGGESFICPDMSTVSVSESQESTVASCLGIPASALELAYICSAGSAPGSAPCMDTAMNPAHGTCVDDFLACYRPSGTCQEGSDSVQYENGARATFDADSQSYRLYNGGDEEPCVTVARVFFGSNQGQAFLHPE